MTVSPRLQVLGGRLLRGCSAGLDEPTLVIDIECNGVDIPDPDADERIRAGIAALFGDAPPSGVAESDWPTAFLVAPADDADSPERRLGEWIVALTVALQQWAHHPVQRGSVVSADPGLLRLAIPWYDEWSLKELLDSTASLVQAWWWPAGEQSTVATVAVLRQRMVAARSKGLSSNSLRVFRAASRRGIPSRVLPSHVQLGWGSGAERIDGLSTHRTSLIAASKAANPAVTSRILAAAGIRILPWAAASDIDTLLEWARDMDIGWPIAVRPVDRPGYHALVGISDENALRQAVMDFAGASPESVFVQKHLGEDDYRVLVVDGRPVAAARRDPPADVTAEVHPDNLLLAARAARVIGLDIAGIDLMTADITRPWYDVGVTIRAVKPQPSLEPHLLADPDRDIAGEVLDAILGDRPARIPTAAITGTNGKSTTASMLQHIWLTAGRRAGVCTTEGVKIGTDVVAVGNFSGEPGARILLEDPTVEVAVMEMPRKGLIVFGHPCDRYDVAALLNIQNDHLHVDGIDTLDQMARLKAEVLERASQAIVVNADDPLCMAVRSRARVERHILVTRFPDTVAAHCSANGEAVFVADRDGAQWIVLANGGDQTPVIAVDDIPATMRGLLSFNADNAMFATAMAHAAGLDAEVIRAGLGSFRNSVEQNPGRYNFIDGLPFQVLLDYAHNGDGLRELCRVVSTLPVEGRRIVCSVLIGNRHVDHLVELAQLAEAFDEVVLSCYEVDLSAEYSRAGQDPVEAMLTAGSAVLRDSGAAAHTAIGDPVEAIGTALSGAVPGDLVVLLAAPEDALPVIAEMRSPQGAG